MIKKIIVCLVMFFTVDGFFHQGHSIYVFTKYIVMANNKEEVKTFVDTSLPSNVNIVISEITNHQWLYNGKKITDIRGINEQ